MAERERRLARPYGGSFQSRLRVMDPDEMDRAVRRIAQEIIERNHGASDVVLVGLQTGGGPLARALAAEIVELGPAEIDGTEVPVGLLDVVMHRDDFGIRPLLPEAPTVMPVDITGRVVVLVDDVLFTGRTVRAALDALNDYGRPRLIQLAVMIDRGHRELPIRPDYVGRDLPTRRDEMVDVSGEGVFLGELVK